MTPSWSGASEAIYAQKERIANRSHEDEPHPPYVEYVYIKIEEQ